MQLDLIEIRAYNYFEYQRQVKQICEADLYTIGRILPNLLPIKITHQRLHKLNFFGGVEEERGKLIKAYNNFIFRFEKTKGNGLVLTINNVIKLPHVIYIHQLQNIYYDVTGDVLKRTANSK
ncbi:hypothetical protein BH10BAC3_BH10BAC3_11900 [soil metagenome]